MPKNNKDNKFVDALKAGAITTPLSIGFHSAIKNIEQSGGLGIVKPPSTSSFLTNLRNAGLQGNQGIDLSFFGNNQLLFKQEPEIARNAWIQAVQSTDPLAQNVLSFAGDIKTTPPGKVISSIEQTLQRNNSMFMARIFNKFKSNVSALRKHRELTGKIPSFKAVEGLSFPAPTNVAINKLPTELRSFHERFIKDTGIMSAGQVRYYSRAGWEGFGTYVFL